MDNLINSTKTIRNVVAIAIVVLATNSYSPLYSMHLIKTKMIGLEDTLLVDRDGNRYPVKKMLDNNLWMTANLKVDIPDSYCYLNAKENCEQYGRLYTWESAQEGCNLLGEGWRLPTNDECNNWQRIMVFRKIRLTIEKELTKPCYMEVAPSLMSYSVVIVPLMVSTNGWMRMAFTGRQQKTTTAQPGYTILEKAPNFLIATMIVKNQGQRPYVV